MTVQFNVGDVVALKSGGPEMTILETSPETTVCMWFPSTAYGGWSDSPMRAPFANAVLERIEEAS